jgi:hypothetical protein
VGGVWYAASKRRTERENWTRHIVIDGGNIFGFTTVCLRIRLGVIVFILSIREDRAGYIAPRGTFRDTRRSGTTSRRM